MQLFKITLKPLKKRVRFAPAQKQERDKKAYSRKRKHKLAELALVFCLLFCSCRNIANTSMDIAECHDRTVQPIKTLVYPFVFGTALVGIGAALIILPYDEKAKEKINKKKAYPLHNNENPFQPF